MKKVMVFGTFDILHPGHVHMLKQAKAYGDFLIAVISRDTTVNEVKKHAPHNTEDVRRAQVEKLDIADKVILGNLDDKYRVIREEKPDVIALGYDQLFYVDKLEEVLDDNVQIVRLAAYKPEEFKSSKLPRDYQLTYEEDLDSHH